MLVLSVALKDRHLNAGPAVRVPLHGMSYSVAAGPTSALKVGDLAPDFELPDQNGKMVRLSDFKGKKNVALAFYVLAFTGG
ncbi:MAG: redoxin domain-containing protein [Acidobacteria bacterium]|nr:redoxin domain-containing protein [Acidobacteriota bacterium]